MRQRSVVCDGNHPILVGGLCFHGCIPFKITEVDLIPCIITNGEMNICVCDRNIVVPYESCGDCC